jgi:prepilin-type N-terminal cleavage/methylation domain-containing protein
MRNFFIHKKRARSTQAGFSLLELLVSLVVFIVITSIILVRHSQFNNTIILTNVAHEISLEIRQAQVYGLGVRRGGNTSGDTDFNLGYGVVIKKSVTNDNNGIDLFSTTNPRQLYTEGYDADNTTNVIRETFKIPKGYIISGLCVNKSTSDCENVDELDIGFVRPFPNAYIHGYDGDNNTCVESSGTISICSSAIITIKSPNSKTVNGNVTGTRTIKVFANGQVAVPLQ